LGRGGGALWRETFRGFASRSAQAVGSPAVFLLAVALVAAWAVSGFFLRFSDAWQLVINTATNLITFFMVFLIQYSQNRDTKAIHLKLDELLRAVEAARTHLVGLENLSDEDLERLDHQFGRIRERAIRKTSEPVIRPQDRP
jgi:low affinity Fe/Cu permease